MSPLKHLGLFITESCNLACPYCFAANMERRVVDEGLARRAIDLMLSGEVASPRVGITFWGGEPLLPFALLERLIRYARQREAESGKELLLSIPTNVTLLTDEKLDVLLDHRVALSLSLDGGPEAQGLRVTAGGRSSYPIVLKKLEIVRGRFGDRPPGVRMTVTPATAATFMENVRFFLERGFIQIYFAPVHEADWSDERLAAFEAQQLELADLWSESLAEGRRIAFPTWDKLLAHRELARRGEVDPYRQQVVCGAGSAMMAMDIHGDLYPCQRFVFYDKSRRVRALGSILDGLPPPEAMRPYRRLDADRAGTASRRCRDCPDLTRCLGLCPAVNDAMTGDIATIAEVQCRLARIEHRAVDRIEARLAGSDAFQRYVDEHLLQIYRPGGISIELAAFVSRVKAADADRLAERAGQILDRLNRGRREAGGGDEP